MNGLFNIPFSAILRLAKKPSYITRAGFLLWYKFWKIYPVTSLLPILDYKFVVDPDTHVDRNLYIFRNVQLEITNFLLRFATKNTVFFDIGANSGYFSLIVSSLAKNSLIHAFEPVPRAYQNFSKTIKINKINNINLNRMAVSDKNSKTDFYVSFNTDVSGLKITKHQKGNQIIKVKTIKLDSYCKLNRIGKVNLIKIDTEGGERDVIYGALNLIKKYKPVLIVEFSNINFPSYGYNTNELYDFLYNLGYRMYSYRKNKLIRFNKKDVCQNDLFCIHRSLNINTVFP